MGPERMPPTPRLVLASASPRRRELLGLLGLAPEVVPPEIDEAVRAGEAPEAYVERLAQEKAAQVARGLPGALVLAADTTVALGADVLGKPASEAEARHMLGRLSGTWHEVFTGVAVDGPLRASLVVRTRVEFRPLSAGEIAWYVATGEPMDKAGAYAVQGRAGAFVARLEGSPTNVVGLPLAEAAALLARAGLRLPWSGP